MDLREDREELTMTDLIAKSGDRRLIRLVADAPFYNSVDLAICDFGGKEGALRKRGKITVEYSAWDVKQLKAQGHDTLEKALGYYKDWIYRTVRRYILVEFDLEEGQWDAILAIVEDHIRNYYEEA